MDRGDGSPSPYLVCRMSWTSGCARRPGLHRDFCRGAACMVRRGAHGMGSTVAVSSLRTTRRPRSRGGQGTRFLGPVRRNLPCHRFVKQFAVRYFTDIADKILIAYFPGTVVFMTKGCPSDGQKLSLVGYRLVCTAMFGLHTMAGRFPGADLSFSVCSRSCHMVSCDQEPELCQPTG